MPTTFLADRGVVKVAGEEARDFLDRIVTSDLDKLGPGSARYAALLMPQGKVLVDFLVTEAAMEDGGGFFLDCPLALAPDLAKRLGLYKLRAKLTIEDLSATLGVAASWSGADLPADDGLLFTDPRFAPLGQRLITARDHAKALADAPEEDWHAHRIGLGVPQGGRDFIYGDVFPHEIDLDQLGGVDFDKGCYVGQEVVSRVEHRATARTRIVLAEYEGGFAPIEGLPVLVGERIIGTTGSQHAGRGLVKIRIDKAGEALAAGEMITAGGVALRLVKPAWARFEVPGAEALASS